jgi:hypothetical protein
MTIPHDPPSRPVEPFEPEDEPETTEPPPPAPEPAEEPGETPDDGLLPGPERIEQLSLDELRELRDAITAWDGPGAERFRERVEGRLAAESEGGES